MLPPQVLEQLVHRASPLPRSSPRPGQPPPTHLPHYQVPPPLPSQAVTCPSPGLGALHPQAEEPLKQMGREAGTTPQAAAQEEVSQWWGWRVRSRV